MKDPAIKKTAILVDGGFYKRKALALFGKKSAAERAAELEKYCKSHIEKREDEQRSLYRIFYYDCPPVNITVYHPLLQKNINLANSDTYKWTNTFHAELASKRKFALRLGELDTNSAMYLLNNNKIKKLLSGKLNVSDLDPFKDFELSIVQKGVDMKIGIDIASLAYKKQVDQIILISGDSDFVPAAKLARREGIDFILDNMRQSVKDNLAIHIDGMQTFTPKANKKQNG